LHDHDGLLIQLDCQGYIDVVQHITNRHIALRDGARGQKSYLTRLIKEKATASSLLLLMARPYPNAFDLEISSSKLLGDDDLISRCALAVADIWEDISQPSAIQY
jgi:hypothetical protein